MAKRRRKVAQGLRRLGALTVQGGGATLKQSAAGLVTFGLHYAAASRVEAVQKHPILAALGIVGAGHFAKRKWPNVGVPMIGAGAYALGQAAAIAREAAKQQAASGDTKALIAPGDVRALVSPGDVGELDDYEPPDAAGVSDLDTMGYSSAMGLGR